MRCPHCIFIDSVAKHIVEQNAWNHFSQWIIRELFKHLHGGKDYCNYEKGNVVKAEYKIIEDIEVDKINKVEN